MAKFYSTETRSLGNVPQNPPGDAAYGGRERIFRSTIALDAPALSSSTAGTVVTTGDTVVLCVRPAGTRFIGGKITSSVSLGTSTIAIGTAAAPAKYRAAAVHTAVDTPTLFGLASAMAAVETGSDEEVILTVAVASLPTTASSRLVIDLEFAAP